MRVERFGLMMLVLVLVPVMVLLAVAVRRVLFLRVRVVRVEGVSAVGIVSGMLGVWRHHHRGRRELMHLLLLLMLRAPVDHRCGVREHALWRE